MDLDLKILAYVLFFLWALAGNEDLCGAPRSYECGSPRRLSPVFIVGIILICIAILLVAVGLFFIFYRRRKQHKEPTVLPTTQPVKTEPVPVAISILMLL